MWEVNGEGDVPVSKLKSTGVEIVRSSTPPLAKKFLKEVVFNILKTMDREFIVNELREVRHSFLKENILQIAFPRSANNVNKYTERYEELGVHKQTPIHIRGAIEYNKLLEKQPKLKTTYDLIHEGDKIKYIYMKPNTKYPHNIYSFKDKWVPEFNLDEQIDREMQFDKSVMKPLERFFELLSWEYPNFKNVNLMELFA
jgi:DNA polymerase elongation subunit (family B)